MPPPAAGRPGPKPKRLYLRWARFGSVAPDAAPRPGLRQQYWRKLERVGRLVAVGATSEPPGELLVFRAEDMDEAQRVLRLDPWRGAEDVAYEVLEWDPKVRGPGVNLDPAPDRGTGRLTALERITVVVRDQETALEWYREVLGLQVRARDPETQFVELSLGKGAVALSLVEPRPEWGEPYYGETLARVGTATGVAFETDAVGPLEQRLRKGGARITESPTRQPWGGVALRFADPDGNEFLAFQRDTDPEAPPSRPPAAGRGPVVPRWGRAPPRSKRL